MCGCGGSSSCERSDEGEEEQDCESPKRADWSKSESSRTVGETRNRSNEDNHEDVPLERTASADISLEFCEVGFSRMSCNLDPPGVGAVRNGDGLP